MIESIYGGNYRLLKDYILLIFFIFFSAGLSFAQKSYDLNNVGFDDTKNIEEKYIYLIQNYKCIFLLYFLCHQIQYYLNHMIFGQKKTQLKKK